MKHRAATLPEHSRRDTFGHLFIFFFFFSILNYNTIGERNKVTVVSGQRRSDFDSADTREFSAQTSETIVNSVDRDGRETGLCL